MDQLSFFEDDRCSGFWLKRENRFKCNDCGFWYYDCTKTPYRYCPKCGRRMLQYILEKSDNLGLLSSP